MSTPAPILQYSLAEATVKGLLPTGYTPLAYIESSGTQWINSGIALNSSTSIYRFECKVGASTRDGHSHSFFGTSSYLTGMMGIYHYSTNNYYSQYILGSYKGTPNFVVAKGDIIEYYLLMNMSAKTYASKIAYNNEVTGSFTAMSNTTDTIRVFKSDDFAGGYWKCYYFRITKDSVLQVDLVPCIQDSNGAIGMYDLVSCSFKANSGSGTFVAGPPLAIGKDGGKSLPEEYLQVEYVGSTYASGTVYPVYRKSDMLPGTYNTSTSAFTTVSGAIGPTVNVGYTWEPNAGSGTLQGLYTNLSGIYDSSKGWVADFATNTSHLSTTIPAVGNNFSVAWWELSSNFNNNSMPWAINPFNPFYSKCLNTSDGSGNPWYVPGTTTVVADVTNNVWHHFVVTGNGTANYLYIDGVKYGLSKTFKGLTGTTLTLNGWGVSNTNYCRNPKITNFQIFNVALTDAQVKELYGK